MGTKPRRCQRFRFLLGTTLRCKVPFCLYCLKLRVWRCRYSARNGPPLQEIGWEPCRVTYWLERRRCRTFLGTWRCQWSPKRSDPPLDTFWVRTSPWIPFKIYFCVLATRLRISCTFISSKEILSSKLAIRLFYTFGGSLWTNLPFESTTSFV